MLRPLGGKFSIEDDPLVNENKVKSIEPTKVVQQTSIISMAEQYARKNDTVQHQVAAGFVIAQAKQDQFATAINMEFLRGFWRFLLGKQVGVDAQRTPWKQQPLYHLPDVRAYIDMFLTKRVEYQKKLWLLKNRAPTNIYQAYLVYKYIVRGQNLETVEYLQDWEFFVRAFDNSTQELFDPKRPDAPRPYYPFPGASDQPPPPPFGGGDGGGPPGGGGPPPPPGAPPRFPGGGPPGGGGGGPDNGPPPRRPGPPPYFPPRDTKEKGEEMDIETEGGDDDDDEPPRGPPGVLVHPGPFQTVMLPPPRGPMDVEVDDLDDDDDEDDESPPRYGGVFKAPPGNDDDGAAPPMRRPRVSSVDWIFSPREPKKPGEEVTTGTGHPPGPPPPPAPPSKEFIKMKTQLQDMNDLLERFLRQGAPPVHVTMPPPEFKVRYPKDKRFGQFIDALGGHFGALQENLGKLLQATQYQQHGFMHDHIQRQNDIISGLLNSYERDRQTAITRMFDLHQQIAVASDETRARLEEMARNLSATTERALQHQADHMLRSARQNAEVERMHQLRHAELMAHNQSVLDFLRQRIEQNDESRHQLTVMQETITEQLRLVSEKLDNRRTEEKAYQAKLKQLRTNIAKVAEREKLLKAELAKAKKSGLGDAQRLQEELALARAKLAGYENQHRLAVEKHRRISEENAQLENQRGLLELQLARARSQLDQAQNRMNRLESELTNTRQQLEMQKKQMKSRDTRVDKVKKSDRESEEDASEVIEDLLDSGLKRKTEESPVPEDDSAAETEEEPPAAAMNEDEDEAVSRPPAKKGRPADGDTGDLGSEQFPEPPEIPQPPEGPGENLRLLSAENEEYRAGIAAAREASRELVGLAIEAMTDARNAIGAIENERTRARRANQFADAERALSQAVGDMDRFFDDAANVRASSFNTQAEVVEFQGDIAMYWENIRTAIESQIEKFKGITGVVERRKE